MEKNITIGIRKIKTKEMEKSFKSKYNFIQTLNLI